MKHRKHNIVVSSLLLLVGAYVVLVAVPAITSNQIIGYLGTYSGGKASIVGVFKNSPADAAGLGEEDIVLKLNGLDVGLWYEWYTTDKKKYLEQTARLIQHPGTYTIQLESSTQESTLQPRGLTSIEIIVHYGIRIFLILFVAGLTVFIVLSRTNERSAFLTCLCFCFAVVWFASDQPYWPRFSSPFFRDVSLAQASILDVMEILSLQLVMGTLLHIALLFPRERAIVEKYEWFPLLSYPAALLPSIFILLTGDGGLLDRTNNAFESRVYVNTILLVLITTLMVDSYIRCDQWPVQKERARWIVSAMGVIALVHVLLWNIPILVNGAPLVSSYNWLLLVIVLLPITLTMSITHHELFGIRGMIKSRIRLLETMLDREKRLINTRDASIRGMQQEIQQLKKALDQYDVVEELETTKSNQGLDKLERQYPELKEIRNDRLIGVSPAWKDVFEQAVLAARGTDPVLIVGESGTGKTDVAWTIHRLSERKNQVYKEVSCAQFEHADPAFALGRIFGIGRGHGLANVAKEGQKGLLEECDGGTLLMDDFDRLPLNVQDLFLYPLEDKAFDPGVGSGPSRSVSVKFIFATNSEPESLVRRGKFRNDVLARIVTRVDIPPLRERKEDIPLLVETFTKRLSEELGHEITVVSNKALNLLNNYSYSSGNVRELKAELHKAANKASLEDDHVLRAGYLSQKLRLNRVEIKPIAEIPPSGSPTNSDLLGSRELQVLRRHGFQITPAEAELGYSHKAKTLSNHLRGICIQALVESDWDTETAARKLAGGDNPKEISKLKTKMERFLSRIEENVNKRTPEKLFNNLPVRYHEALNQTIAKVDSGINV